MVKNISTEQERRLRNGLVSALSISDLSSFSYRVLSMSNDKAVIRVGYSGDIKGKDIPNTQVVVKWFFSDPNGTSFQNEAVHSSVNSLDSLFLDELRGLRNTSAFLGSHFAPEIKAASENDRMIVMENLEGSPRKRTFLSYAARGGYDGIGSFIPSGALNVMLNVAVILGSFTESLDFFSEKLDEKHDYGADAEARSNRWVGLTRERLIRLSSHKHEGSNFLIQPSELEEKLTLLGQLSRSFGEMSQYSHGDFNLLQLLQNKVIDYELFGKYQPAKDLGTLLVVVGLADASGLVLSENFSEILDLNLATQALTYKRLQKIDDVNQVGQVAKCLRRMNGEAYNLRKSHSKDNLNLMAKAHMGSSEDYADFKLNVYYHAFNELLRLGAAYDRMHSNGRTNGSFVNDMKGIYRGIESMLNYVTSNDDLFAGVSNQKEKKEYFLEQHKLLTDAKIIN